MVREPALLLAGARSVVNSGVQPALSQKPAFGPGARGHDVFARSSKESARTHDDQEPEH